MVYRIFQTKDALDIANSNWCYARNLAGVVDMINGVPIDPQITSCWSEGRLMKDGRLACTIPNNWAEEFGGSEEDLSEDDFVQYEM